MNEAMPVAVSFRARGVTSIRLSAAWSGKVSSRSARAWVTAWLLRPVPLPEDPGPGPVRLSLRLSHGEVRSLERTSRGTASSAVRRVLALHINSTEPQNQTTKPNSVFAKVLGIGVSLLILFVFSASDVGQSGARTTGTS